MSTLDTDTDAGEYAEEPPLTAAAPRELKRLIRDWRRGRATTNLTEAFHDAYIALIGALMIGAMVVNVVLKAQRVVAGCSTATCVSARALLPWAAFAAAVAVALAISRLFGPVLASAAEGFWLLEAPISRSKMLRSRLVAIVAVSLGGGALIGGLVSALTGTGVRGIVVWAAATGLSAAAAVAFAAGQQGIERHRLTRVASYFFGLAGVATLLGVIGIAAGWFRLGLSDDLSTELGLLMVGFAGLVLIASLVLAGLRLGQIRRTRLLSGGALVSGISGSFYALDFGLARDIVVDRHAREVGHVKPARGKGLDTQALTWREWQRLRRFPQPLVVLAGTVVVPYACDALGMSVLTPVFGALALFGATIGLLGGLRVLTRTGGLARCFPFSMAQIKLAMITVPAILAAVWAVLVTPAFLGFGDSSTHRSFLEASGMSIATAAAGLLAGVRWTTAKGVDFSKPMVSTQAGALPPGLVGNIFRGFDVALLTTAPMLLGFSPVWSLVIAAIAAGLLLNSMDMESMQARQREQQKLLDQQKRDRENAVMINKQRKR
jgi:hypothetical protein